MQDAIFVNQLCREGEIIGDYKLPPPEDIREHFISRNPPRAQMMLGN